MFVLSGLFHVILAELVEPGNGKSPYSFVKDSMFATADFTMSPVEGIGLYFCLLPLIVRPSCHS